MNSMFAEAYNLTTLDLSSFDVSNIVNMDYMFFQCRNLETIYVRNEYGDWTSDMRGRSTGDNMFGECRKLKGYDPDFTDVSRANVFNYFTAKPDPVIPGGSCGENATWGFDTSISTLTISGTGAIASYDVGTQPWSSLSDAIKTVVIEDGVTRFSSSSMFYKYASLENVTIGSGVTQIDPLAFNSCDKLTSVTFTRPRAQQSLLITEDVFGSGAALSYAGEGNFVLYDGNTEIKEGTDLSTLNEKALTWKESVPACTVTWKDWDDSVLETDGDVAVGATPEYNGETPKRDYDGQHTYSTLPCLTSKPHSFVPVLT